MSVITRQQDQIIEQLAHTHGRVAINHDHTDVLATVPDGHTWRISPDGDLARSEAQPSDVCGWCGGPDLPGTVCPWSLICKTCHAAPGHSCRQPCGSDRALHHSRVREAERLELAASIIPAAQLAVAR